MKLEVGMYVRIKWGIGKIKRIYDEKYKGRISVATNKTAYGMEEKDILKASHNIIDLIEVGDYVNGEKVYQENGHLFVGNWWIENKNIKSIVTKEQFESAQYKVD